MANSKNLIKDIFISLYLSKPIHKITIIELSKKANITRGTFYLYYSDIYEVLEEIENERLIALHGKVNFKLNHLKYNFDFNMDLPANLANDLFSEIENHKTYFKALLCTPSYPSFKYKIENLIRENFSYILKSKSNLETFDFLIEYISSAHISCLILWLKKDCIPPKEEIINTISKILNSILSTF
ncbi:MAG: TetR/AcrR family transcriptional regulator [Clostridium sp.]